MGVPGSQIIFRHILPNMASLLIIDATVNVSCLILAEVGLSFFGFGVQPPDVSLGTLIGDYAGTALTRTRGCSTSRDGPRRARPRGQSRRRRPARRPRPELRDQLSARNAGRSGVTVTNSAAAWPPVDDRAAARRQRPVGDVPQRGRRGDGRPRPVSYASTPARCSASSASPARASRSRRWPSWACCRRTRAVTGSVRLPGPRAARAVRQASCRRSAATRSR